MSYKQFRPEQTGATPHQAVTRYQHTVSADGKMHPDRIRPMAGQNYV
ncbi:MAG: hypothetical protein HPY44_18935 [Armatimonadetes bacterium]|nr:hypothetical protein [Armatimonadota bacterium]